MDSICCSDVDHCCCIEKPQPHRKYVAAVLFEWDCWLWQICNCISAPSVNGVHFSMAPVALKSDWTVKLTGQPPLTLLPIIMVRGQYNCSYDSIEIVLISAKVGLATALQQAAAALFYWHY
ncbi:hypothetical protein T10_4131 [Trichinella papuae]|uniref:Uncharacterized protein n=1 Tax=Trichinella papuae TaxID=268474 RepID=A0A0V1MWN2_9BILA|nr:hypothetical protein T10_4131 [Trichinella papuae]